MRNRIGNIIQINKYDKAFYVTSAINYALRLFGLERTRQGDDGTYHFKTLTLNAAIVDVAAVVEGILSVYTFCWILQSNNAAIANLSTNPLKLLNRAISSLIWGLQVVVSVASVQWEPEESARAYHDAMQKLDDNLMRFKRDAYRHRRSRCNWMFFGTLTLQFLGLLYHFHTSIRNGPYVVVVAAITELTKLVTAISTLDYVVKLYIFNTKVTIFSVKINELAEPTWISVLRAAKTGEERRSVQRVERVISCYNMIREMCTIINDRYSRQVVIIYANAISSAITFTYTLILNTTNKYNEKVTFSYYETMLLFVINTLLTTVFTVWIVGYVMSIENQFKSIVLAVEIALLDSQCLSEGERESWARLAALCRRWPVQFTACGFFKLDYSLLGGMLGSMLTYTILLTQLNNPNKAA